MKWFFLSLLFLIVGVYIFIQTPFGQNWIARQITKRFSRDLQTKISIQHVSFSLLNNMHLQGVMVEDRQGDTLLYAGEVTVKITDWFIFKKEAELKFIGLENAIVNFQRTDSVWSQQFMLDYFTSTKTGTKKKKAGIQFDLKKVELKNVAFVKKDGWLGQDMYFHVNGMNLDADTISFGSNAYQVKSLLLFDPIMRMRNYTGRKPRDSTMQDQPVEEISQALAWNRGQTSFKIGNVKIINGTFESTRDNNPAKAGHFDGQHISFTEINGELNRASFIKDTVFSNLKLTAKERSGLELKNLTADVKFTPQGMAFSDLDLQTNRSVIRNYFSMSYNDMSEMSDFIHKVKMAAIFDDSYVDSDDLAFFAPAMRTWKKKISLEGKVRGTVDELAGRDLVVQAGTSTIINGDLNLTGLPDINKTFIDFKANDFRTTYNDIVTIVPAMRRVKQPDLRRLGYINFQGSFTGFTRDFVTYGTIQTNLGTVVTDLNMKLPLGKDPVYSGKISTNNFKLGQFLGDSKIGSVGLDLTVKGSGFNEKSRNSIIDGTVKFADYNNYRYENITVNGKLDKKRFEGVASIKDKNADMVLNGIIDFNTDPPKFNLVADVAQANFKNLNLTQEDLGFTGKLNFNFTGSNLDNFLGTADIRDAIFTRAGRRLPFDSLVVTSNYVNGVKTLRALSNEIEANITGDFSMVGLPDAVRLLLNKYYPAYVKAPLRYPSNQNIQFNITTYNIEEYLQLIDSSLAGFNNSHIVGNLNLSKNELNLTADIPQFIVGKFNFNDVRLVAKGNQDSLVLNGETRNIRINDSLSIPLAVFHVNAHNDQSRVSIVTGANQTIDKANLNALVLTFADGIDIDMDPSSFILNGKTWTIDENGKLSFRKNKPISGQLVLSEADQRLVLRTQPSPRGNWNDIKVELTKLNLGDLAPIFLPRNRLEGWMTGTILVEDPANNLKLSSTDIQTQFLRLDNDSLGEVRTSLAYDNLTKELQITGSTLNQENFLGFDGRIFLDPAKGKNNLITLKARNFQIKILERFLGTLFSDMQGYLTGDITISGEFSQLAVAGKGRLKDAGLQVNFTQVFYAIQDTDIEMKSTEIKLDGLILTDTVTGNPLYVSGGIEHESFKNMFYNLNISTRKPNTTGDNNNLPVLLMNTSYKDNKQFYGKVFGTGSLTLAGPQSDMFMTINGIASSTDSSVVTIPASSTRESGIADFLVERQFGKEMVETNVNPNAVNIIYDVEVTATPAVTVYVVMDELTGDVIKGRGSGTLNIRSGTSEPLTLRGRFDIAEGDYIFTFQSFFKKPFVLKEGEDNYIEWYGDPNDAVINITAVYTATNVSFAPLVTSLANINEGVARTSENVNVVAKLTEKLFHPKFDFDLEFLQSSVVYREPTLAFSLQQLQKNENEINKQATYLVVLGSFAPIEGGDAGVSLGSFATNSLSGIFFNVVNEQIKKIFSSIFKSDKLNFNLNTTLYNRNVIAGGAFNLGSNINASIGSSLFKNRVVWSFGGSVEGFVQTGTTQTQRGFLTNFTVDILINQSGTFRATLFRKEDIDYLTTNVQGSGKQSRLGGGLSFRKDFDHLFKKRKKKTETPAVEPVATPGTDNN